MISPTHRTLPANTQHYWQEKAYLKPGGIRTRNAIKEGTAEPRLRPRLPMSVTHNKWWSAIKLGTLWWRRRTTVIKIYGECLNKKTYYSKRHFAINPPQNTPPRFEHIYPIVLATFQRNSGSPLSWLSLVAQSWLLRCPESIQNVYFSRSFWLWGRARSRTVPDPVNKVDEDTP